jgi:hypothetical protein
MKRRKGEISFACMLDSEPLGIEMAEIERVPTLPLPLCALQTGNSELP